MTEKTDKKVSKIKEAIGKKLISLVQYDKGGQQAYLFILDKINLELMNSIRTQTTADHLFLTKQELLDATDVFPLEFLNIKNHHTLLEGEDVLAKLTFDKKHIRRQLEFEFRSKLIHLREEYLISNTKKQQRQILLSALPALAPVLDGLLYLKGIKSGGDQKEDIIEIEKEYLQDLSVLHDLEKIKKAKPGLFGKAKYLKGKEQDYTKELLDLLANLSFKLDKLKI